MTTPWIPAGPAGLGLDLGRDGRTTEDGWLVRPFRADAGLNGRTGALQGGFGAGLALAAARSADRFGAPATRLDATFRAPVSVGQELEVRARPGEEPAHHDVRAYEGERLLVEAEVELAGHDPVARVHDLVELATVPLPTAETQEVRPTCWVCGPRPVHPLGQRLLPGWHDDGAVVSPWVAGDELAVDGIVDPVVVTAMLACPAAWATFRHVRERGDALAVLGTYHVRYFRDVPVMEPLRLVARDDGAQRRRLHARTALVDEDEIVYAMSSAILVSLSERPAD